MRLSVFQADKNVEIVMSDSFDLAATLDCGQAFRFELCEDGTWRGVVQGKYLCLHQEYNKLILHDTDFEEFESVWRNYFDLDRDYTYIKEVLCEDKTLKNACALAGGIRVLKQDPWECLCSFIISQNNNIPRIKKLVEALCRECGEKTADGYAFPIPEAIADLGVDRLREMKTGFRAAYIYDAATKVAEGSIDLEGLKELDTDTALCELQKIKGVGLKVASCVALFGLNKLDTFPVDVWIKRVLEKYYPLGLDINTLGEYRGLSQQYLFYYERYKNV